MKLDLTHMKLPRLCLGAVAGLALMASGCSSTKEVNYFQELQAGQEYSLPALTSIKLQPDDKLNIIVSTTDPRLNSLYNLPVAETRLNNNTSGTNISTSYSGYERLTQSTATATLISRCSVSFISRE